MQIKPEIFKEYDIRGVYPHEINEDIFYRLGAAFVQYLKIKGFIGNIVVSCDVRDSSPSLKDAFVNGVVDQGRDVIDIGLATTPLFYFSVTKSKAAGGAMITASHNPAQFNGLKLVFEKAESLLATEYQELYKLMSKEAKRKISIGKSTQESFVDDYIDFVLRQVKLKNKLSIVVDASGGSAGFLLKNFFERSAFKDIKIKELFFEPDSNFKKHLPNPLLEESQKFVKKEIGGGNYNLGCIFDADADRIIFIDERGEAVRGDLITALIADYIIKKGLVLADLRSTRALFELAEKKNIKIEKTRVGHVNIKKALKEERGEFAGELSGHYYYKSLDYTESSILTLIYVLNILSSSDKTFSELLGKYKKYFHSGEINFKVSDRGKIIEKLKEGYSDGKQSDLDGLSAEYNDWWFNIRPSKTEEVVRLVIEAQSKKLLKEKVRELSDKIK